MTEVVRSHRDLKVWRDGIALCAAVYRATESLPKSEVFGVVSQMRRASSSVPANVAEGCARRNTSEFVHFLHVARGSLAELDTYIRICESLEYLKPEQVEALDGRVAEVGKMLSGLISKLRITDRCVG